MEELNIVEKKDMVEPAPTVPNSPEQMVEAAHTSATAVLIADSDEVKAEIMKGAEQVVHNKTKAIQNRAELEAKKALFNNNRSACGCFGFEEDTTESWAVNYMKIWNRVFTLLWLVVGSFTFAPVLFISSKMGAIVKRAWIAVTLSILIYVLILASPLIVYFVNRLGGIAK